MTTDDYCGCCGGDAAAPPKGEHGRCCAALHDEGECAICPPTQCPGPQCPGSIKEA